MIEDTIPSQQKPAEPSKVGVVTAQKVNGVSMKMNETW